MNRSRIAAVAQSLREADRSSASRRAGISSQLESTNAFCSTFVGTACYMAPERLSGGAYSYSADIWSFGLILLELLLGRYPYPAADNYFKLLSSIMDGDAPTVPRTAVANVHDAVASCTATRAHGAAQCAASSNEAARRTA